MLKRLSPRERLEQLLFDLTPMLRAAFMDAIDDIRSNIVLRRIVERLERGDINGAIAAIAFRQQIEAGRVQPQHITKEHPRAQHVAMHGQVVPFDQSFKAPDGTLIRYPHAPGTPTRHTIGCKCFAEYKIDFVAQLVR